MDELNFHQMPKWMPEALQIQMMIDVWARGYDVPREAVIRQIPIAYAWAQSNPKKAPRKNILRYLNTFMRKAQEFGNLKVPAPRPAALPTDLAVDMTPEEMVEIRKKNMGR